MKATTDVIEELLEADSELELDLADDEEAEVRRGGRRPSRLARFRARGTRPQRSSGRFPKRPKWPPPGRPQPPWFRRSHLLRRREPMPCICPAHGTEFVRWVQSSLNQLLELNLPVDGIMNAATRNALRRFQGQAGLTVDGIAGPETEKALIDAKGGQFGQAGEAEEFEVLEGLELDLADLEVDGIPGPGTRRALMAAQRGSTQFGRVGRHERPPKLNNEVMPNLEMETLGVGTTSNDTCIKSFTVGNFAYTGQRLTNSQKNLIVSIARDIFGGGGGVPPLSQVKEVRIIGFSSGTRRLHLHANQRAVSVFEELRKRLLGLGATPGELNNKITFGDPVTKPVASQAASDPNFRKVVICLVRPTSTKPKIGPNYPRPARAYPSYVPLEMIEWLESPARGIETRRFASADRRYKFLVAWKSEKPQIGCGGGVEFADRSWFAAVTDDRRYWRKFSPSESVAKIAADAQRTYNEKIAWLMEQKKLCSIKAREAVRQDDKKWLWDLFTVVYKSIPVPGATGQLSKLVDLIGNTPDFISTLKDLK
jgi:hypothetical protein